MITDAQDIAAAWEQEQRANHERYKEALYCYDYVIGDQYTQDQLDWHKKWQLTARPYNLTLAQVVTVDGYGIQNRVNVKAIPVEPGDNKMAGYVTEAMQQAYRETEATYHIKRALSDAVIAGIGYIGQGWIVGGKYADGMLDMYRPNPFNIFEDYSHGEPSLTKARFRGVNKWVTVDRLISAWGQDDPELVNMLERAADLAFGPEFRKAQRNNYFAATHQFGGKIDRSFKRLSGLGSDINRMRPLSLYLDANLGLVRALELHFFKPTKKKVIIDPTTSEVISLPGHWMKSPQKIGEALRYFGLDERSVRERQIDEAWVAVAVPGLLPRTLIVNEAYEVQIEQLAIEPIECYDFDPRLEKRRSVVQMIMPIQSSFNELRGYQQDLIRREMHPDWLVPKGSIDENDPLDMETWKSRKIGRLLLYNEKASGAVPEPMRNENLGPLLSMDMNVNMEMLNRVTGITPALSGLKDSKKDGADLFAQMVDQGEIMIAPILDNLRRSFKRIANFSFASLQTYMVYPRWIRPLTAGGDVDWRRAVQVNRFDPDLRRAVDDITVGRYDIVLDGATAHPVERERNFQLRIKMLPYLNPLFRELQMGSMFKLSGWSDSDELIRLWKFSIYQMYGPMVLKALEDMELTEKMMEEGSIDPNMVTKQQMLQQFLLSAMGGSPGGGPAGGGMMPGQPGMPTMPNNLLGPRETNNMAVPQDQSGVAL